MAQTVEMVWQLAAALDLNDRPKLEIQTRHEATLQSVDSGRRQQRALRLQAMIELARAWTNPDRRPRWRERESGQRV